MSYQIGLIVSLAVFVLGTLIAVYFSLRSHKQNFFIKAFIVSVFLSSTALFFPYNSDLFNGNLLSLAVTLLASAHTAIRLFIVDCDFEFVISVTENFTPFLKTVYTGWATVLLILSPILTAGAALSFFANISARNKYLLGFFRDTYVFSELNEYSYALAQSLKASDPKRMIVFTDVYEKNDEDISEITDKAKMLNAVIFKRDITTINFRTHSKKRKLYFFIMGSNDEENTNHTIFLASPYDQKIHIFKSKKYSDSRNGYDYPRGDTRLYLFTTDSTSEMQLNFIKPKYIKLRRINEVQSLVYKLINDHGMEIFDSAIETGNTVPNSVSGKNDPEKKISALLIGLGSYGTEMLRALPWLGQMHPYRTEIMAFDLRKDAASVFRSSYPELYDFDPLTEEFDGTKKYNGDFDTPGESHYSITIVPDIDVKHHEFDKIISKLDNTTYVFVALGNDDLNINTAIKIRKLLRRVGCEPVIHAVVYNPNKQKMLITDFSKGEDPSKRSSSFRILPFGDISTRYSEECVLNSDIEAAALERHMKYTYKCIEEEKKTGEEKEKAIREGIESFWSSDYNYRSSIASALHTKFKVACNIPGSGKAPIERTPEEKYFYANMEHCRWNAYIRSEGYVKADKRDKLIKTHHLLIPFDDLPYSEQTKDED